jgi:hypothetical protein
MNSTDSRIIFRTVKGATSTYRVEVDGKHVLDVRRIRSADWAHSALWASYLPGYRWTYVSGGNSRRADRPVCVGQAESRLEAAKRGLATRKRAAEQVAAEVAEAAAR